MLRLVRLSLLFPHWLLPLKNKSVHTTLRHQGGVRILWRDCGAVSLSKKTKSQKHLHKLFNNHIDVVNNMLHKTAILVKSGHILWRKCPLVFPLMSYNCSASTL